MNGDLPPAGKLKKIFGVDITDAAQLRGLFNGVAGQSAADGHILISHALYKKYLKLYDLSDELVNALYNVLADTEHQLIMEEAQALGYALPDTDLFRRELEAYREFLSELNPYQAQAVKDGHVLMSGEAANILNQLTDYNCYMVGHIFDGCFNTEYMRHFGFLRQAGVKYAGATALQETMNVLVAMMTIQKSMDSPAPEKSPLRGAAP